MKQFAGAVPQIPTECPAGVLLATCKAPNGLWRVRAVAPGMALRQAGTLRQRRHLFLLSSGSMAWLRCGGAQEVREHSGSNRSRLGEMGSLRPKDGLNSLIFARFHIRFILLRYCLNIMRPAASVGIIGGPVSLWKTEPMEGI